MGDSHKIKNKFLSAKSKPEMTKRNDIPQIKQAFTVEDGMYIISENYELRYLSKKKIVIDVHTENIVKKNIWHNIIVESFTITWTKYKVEQQMLLFAVWPKGAECPKTSQKPNQRR